MFPWVGKKLLDSANIECQAENSGAVCHETAKAIHIKAETAFALPVSTTNP